MRRTIQSNSLDSDALKNALELSKLSFNWKFVACQAALLMGILIFQNVALGAILSLSMYFLWQKRRNRREAVVALFVFACVLASSREGGLQYWKIWRLFFAFLVVLEAVRVFRTMAKATRQNLLGFALLVVLCTGVPALLSDHVAEGLEEMVLLTSMWWAMTVLGVPDSSEASAVRFSTLVHAGVVVVLVSVFGSIVDFDLAHLGGRFRGIFGNPNEFSHWWLTLFVMGMVASKKMASPRTMLLILATLALFLWSGTRGAMIAAMLSLMGWFLQGRDTSISSRLSKLLLLAVGIFALAAVSMESVLNFLPERVVRRESLIEGGGRLLAWEHAVDQIEEQPWLGNGGGAEERFFRENYSFFAAQNHQGLSHNSWLAFAMNFGVPATVLLFAALLSRLGLLQRRLLLVGLLPLVVSFTLEGWLTAPMSASSPMLFFVGALIPHLGLSEMERES